MRRNVRAMWRSVLLAVVASGVLLGLSGASTPAAACSMAGTSLDFDGTVTAIDGSKVSYRVLRVRQNDLMGAAQPLDPGATVAVSYSGTTRPLHRGESYRVVGWASQAEGFTSQVAYDFTGDCGTGAGTSALDGSYLETATGIDRYWRYGVAGLVVLLGGSLAVGAFRAHRRGQPWRLL